jgi:hypothetical protein
MKTALPKWDFTPWTTESLEKHRDEHVESVKYVKARIAEGAPNWTAEELEVLETVVAESNAELESRKQTA